MAIFYQTLINKVQNTRKVQKIIRILVVVFFFYLLEYLKGPTRNNYNSNIRLVNDPLKISANSKIPLFHS